MRVFIFAILFSVMLFSSELHRCVFEENYECFYKALDSEDIDVVNSSGLTPLHIAIKKTDFKMAQILLDRGANINHQDNNGNTPLILAVKKKNLELVTFVVLSGGDVNLANSDGITPLHQAAFSGNEKIVDFLLKAHANPHLLNNDGYSAYDFAMAREFYSIATLIKMYM